MTDKEFKANEWPDENNRKYRIAFPVVRCFDCGRRYEIEKGYCRSTRATVGLKPRISLYCRICEPRHFQLNQDEEWQGKYRHLTVLHVFISIFKFMGQAWTSLRQHRILVEHTLVICSRLFFKDFAKNIQLIFIIFWKVRNSYFQGPLFSGCFRKQLCW